MLKSKKHNQYLSILLLICLVYDFIGDNQIDLFIYTITFITKFISYFYLKFLLDCINIVVIIKLLTLFSVSAHLFFIFSSVIFILLYNFFSTEQFQEQSFNEIKLTFHQLALTFSKAIIAVP